ncbi:MAG TPA: hypothetical protein V6C76_01820 [Drouetiella sp.]
MIDTTNVNNEKDFSEVGSKQSTRSARLFALLSNPYVHAAILVLVVALCFGRTLTSYFLADDFGEISYVSRIFNGEPQLFFLNFTGNYMQIPGMNVYRPWLLVSLVLDFLVYRANAVGYYFTNLAFFTGDVLLTYAVARQLTSTWTKTRSALAAFFGALLFAANPLRCESVSWVVGRVDIVCCFFYLVSFLLFLKSRPSVAPTPGRRKLLIGLGVLSFFLAMGTKEMAIGLPALLLVTEFFNIGASEADSRTVMQRAKDSLWFSAPLWVSTALYFVIRFLCLGTLGGGYVAGFGASQMSFMIQRWLDLDTLGRLFYPLCNSLFAKPNLFSELLSACYIGLAGIGLIRLFEKKISLHWALFLAAWMVTAAVPIFQLWGLGFDLEGARFYYFLSIPICLTAPLLLFRPSSNLRTSAELKLLVATAVALTALAAVMGRVAMLTDLEWVHAGKENRQVAQQAQKLAESHPTGSLAVLGIPKERNGAHQILNGITFDTMLSPPFTNKSYAERFQTFDPIMFGPAQFVNAVRFKNVLKRTGGEFFVWNQDDANFRRHRIDVNVAHDKVVSLPISGQGQGWLPHAHSRAVYSVGDDFVQMTNVQEGDSLRLDKLDIAPASADFLEFQYKATGVPANAQFKVFVSGAGSESESQSVSAMSDSPEFRTVRVRLSKYWRYFCLEKIAAIVVQPYPCASVTMRDFKLVPAELVAPEIRLATTDLDTTGVAHVEPNAVELTISPASITGAKSCKIEVGKTNFFFDNFENATDANPVERSIPARLDQLKVAIPADCFKQPGFYELRARYENESGKDVGEFSNVLTVRIGKAQADQR